MVVEVDFLLHKDIRLPHFFFHQPQCCICFLICFSQKQEERRTQLLELERQMAENQAKLAMMSAQDKEAKQKDYINMQKVRFSLTKIQT